MYQQRSGLAAASELDEAIFVNDQLEALVAEMIEKGIVFEDAVSEFEKRFIKQVLKKVDGNQSKAAHMLGIHRNTLGRKLGQFGLGDNHSHRRELTIHTRGTTPPRRGSRPSPRH